MENATKALIMAAEILIGIAIISIGVYLMADRRQPGQEYQRQISQLEIMKFNSYFDQFVNRDDITPQEVVSAVQYAREFNNVDDPIITISVNISDYNSGDAMNDFDPVDFMKNRIQTSDTYKKNDGGEWETKTPEQGGKKIPVEYKCLIGEEDYDTNTGIITNIKFQRMRT